MAPLSGLRELEEQASQSKAATQSGLCADTIVLTMNGERRADTLRAGDRLITRDAGMAYLKSVTLHHVQMDAIRIKAGSLGHTRPPEDVILPCETQILVRDWRANALFGQTQALVRACDLKDGEYVSLLKDQQLTVVRLIFERPHIIYAGGLELACQTPD